MKRFGQLLPAFAVVALLASCGKDPNSPGIEYMPDMYRSPAIEAYVDYGQDPWKVGDSLAVVQRNTPSAMKPVAGTISQDRNGVSMNSMPYPFPNTTEGYEAAGVELSSPIGTTEANIAKGEVLYNRYCVHCHGEKGDGMGKIAQNGHIEGIPSYSGKLVDLPVGKMYHTLTYGKGLMGSHASQLSALERWEVIEYVKVLQGTSVLESDNEPQPTGTMVDAGSENHDSDAHGDDAATAMNH
ncbi:MAG: c-type cytochrome [Flavobacteriales bacterium]